MTIAKLRAPLVLVHGLFGFDRLRLAGYTVATYFPGIVPLLEAAGNRVLLPALRPTAAIAVRAAQLKAFILKHCPSEAVHIIAHSLGGLDARYMITHLGMAQRVLTLTTLGTPHHGTTFAEWGVRRASWILQPILRMLDIPDGAFYDLRPAACRLFNQRTPDAVGVRYFSVAGLLECRWSTPGWWLSHGIVARAEGPNDGVVSLASAQWGEEFQVWPGDHFRLVNWVSLMGYSPVPRDPTPRWGKLLQRLRDMGY
ncbi:MAG: hypothetical protein NZO58_12295 [Gemmataceae bacterium]|nr:hypothetical protein [Gemmataceae bacterium]